MEVVLKIRQGGSFSSPGLKQVGHVALSRGEIPHTQPLDGELDRNDSIGNVFNPMRLCPLACRLNAQSMHPLVHRFHVMREKTLGIAPFLSNDSAFVLKQYG